MKINNSVARDVTDAAHKFYIERSMHTDETPEAFKLRCFISGLIDVAHKEGYEITITNLSTNDVSKFDIE